MIHQLTTRRAATQTGRAVVAVLVAMLVALGLSAPASAHTDFVGSSPSDGETIEGPLTDIVLTFTNPAVVAGDGFVLLTPDGTTRAPTDLDPTDGTEFIATFDPALTDGTYGFRWQVQAGDAHPIDGSFRFTVTGAPAPTTTAAHATTAPATTAPAASEAATSAPATTVAGAVALEEFLDDDGGAGPWLGRFGRILSIGGTIFAAGVTAALVWVVRGRRDELDHLLSWIRLAGVALVAGGLTEMAALLEASDTSFGDAATTRPGAAALLTLVGGVLVVLGLGAGVGRIANPPRSLSAAVAIDERESTTSEAGHPDSRRDALQWLPDTTAIVGLVGIALAIAAYWFDGHTVSRGPWALHAAINLVHVGAASAWAGGVFAIGALAALRRHRRSDIGLAPMIVRFSSIAAVSLAALTVAGAVMTWLVIDSVDDLWTSNWGRVLIAKIAIVALAASLGGYNHLKLRPELDARPDDPSLAHHLRVSLLVESILLAGAIVMTAVLVATAT
jgi:copper transport protein